MEIYRCYQNDLDVFWHIRDEFTFVENRMKVENLLSSLYLARTCLALGDENTSWAPHILYKTCKEEFRQWSTGKRKGVTFEVLISCSDKAALTTGQTGHVPRGPKLLSGANFLVNYFKIVV